MPAQEEEPTTLAESTALAAFSKLSRDQQAAFVTRLALALEDKPRRELLAKLSLAQSRNSGSDRDLDMWSEAVYSVLLGPDGGGAGADIAPMVVKRLVGASANWGPVEDFMRRAGYSKLKVVERAAMYSLLAGLVVASAREQARDMRIPFSAKLVAMRAQHARGIFENSFPGYIGSGLSLMLARRVTGGGREAG